MNMPILRGGLQHDSQASEAVKVSELMDKLLSEGMLALVRGRERMWERQKERECVCVHCLLKTSFEGAGVACFNAPALDCRSE